MSLFTLQELIDDIEKAEERSAPALAGEEASTINVMGSPMVVDPSVPPGEVHIKNIGPSAPAPAGEKAVCPICDGGPGNDCACTCPKESAAPAPVADEDFVDCPHDVLLTVCTSCHRAALVAAEIKGLRDGIKKAAQHIINSNNLLNTFTVWKENIAKELLALADKLERIE